MDLLLIVQTTAISTFIIFFITVFLPKFTRKNNNIKKFFFANSKMLKDSLIFTLFYVFLFGHLFYFNENKSSSIIYIFGFLSAIIGLLVALIGRLQLAKLWNPLTNIYNSNKILDKGVYSIIRHPIYFGRFLFFLGVALMLNLYGILVIIAYWFYLRSRLLKEEKYLPRLLDNIISQNLLDYEIIVSDGNSKDKTLKIAKQYGCKTVVSKRRKPSIQRNNGAKKAKGELLFFVDADTLLPDNFFKNALREFHRKNLGVAGFYFKLNSKKLVYRLATLWGYSSAFLLHRISPISIGAAILCKKKYHDLAGGFNEELFMGEDHLYSKALTKVGAKFGLISSTKILFDVRRFVKEGPFKVAFKWYYMLFYYFLYGPFKKEIIEYEFGNY